MVNSMAAYDFAEFDIRAWSLFGMTTHVARRVAKRARKVGAKSLAVLVVGSAAAVGVGQSLSLPLTFVADSLEAVDRGSVVAEFGEISDPNTYWPDLLSELRSWPSITVDKSEVDIPSAI